MNQRDAGVTQDSRLDYMSVGNYPLSVATGDAVKSHRLPSVAENGEGLDQGTGGSDDEVWMDSRNSAAHRFGVERKQHRKSGYWIPSNH